jgi:hypothetical protein
MTDPILPETIVQLDQFRPKKPDLVWECNCGGQRFYLNMDKSCTCVACGTVRTSLIWGMCD